MTNVILFTAFLLAAAFFALAAGELRGIRQIVRERCDRLTVELHAVEDILAEHKGDLNGLENGLTTLVKADAETTAALGKLWLAFDKMAEPLQALTKRAEAEDAARERYAALAACLEELQKAAPAQTEELRQLRGEIGGLAREMQLMAGPVSNMNGLDARLSKSMEEGVMNLMHYAAGKTSGGVEVGLG